MKIGLLAMSGVRAYDQELLDLGLTLPGFVERSKVIAQLPSLGLLYLAAVTPPGHDIHYYEATSAGEEPADIYSCDLVAISTFSAQVNEAYAIARDLRARGVKVAMGGLHVTVRPDEAQRQADYVILGEGENVWPAVVAAAERQAPPQIFRAADYPPVDASHLPTPRYDLLADRAFNRYTVQTSRGCPWRCDFCASNVMLRQVYRKRPIDQILRDIAAIRQVDPEPFIEFADDNTFVDKAWGRELCRALAPLGLKWFTETDISVADDAELLDLLHDSGCRQVLIGLESPAQRALEGMELRSNFKARRAGDYQDAIRRIQDHGVTVNGCFILGLDDHTPDIFEQVLAFARETPLYEVQITVLTPFPGTPLYDRLLAEGRLLQPDKWELCTLFDVNYQPAQMSVEELRRGFRRLAAELYSQDCTDARRKGVLARIKQRRRMMMDN